MDGHELQALRKAAGLTPAAMAERLGIGRRALVDLEAATTVPTLQRLAVERLLLAEAVARESVPSRRWDEPRSKMAASAPPVPARPINRPSPVSGALLRSWRHRPILMSWPPDNREIAGPVG